MTLYFNQTFGTTDIPGRSRCSESSPLLKRIRTGMRCTTLTKLPVAFSGGSRLMTAPVRGHAFYVAVIRDAERVHLNIHWLARPHSF